MHDFVPALIGGVMIGLAAILLMAVNGKILGVSGILSQLPFDLTADGVWRLSFVSGVLVAPILWMFVAGYQPPVEITGNTLFLVAGGLLVGAGTVLGNGCTSGHGVCGLSRLSVRSMFATVVFMLSAIITVWAVNTVGGS